MRDPNLAAAVLFYGLPGSTRALAARYCNRLGAQIAERKQNPFGPVSLPPPQMDQRRTKTLEPEIIRARTVLDPVEKRRQLHELVSGIQKIKVKHLLAGHITLSEYKTKMPDGNRKNDPQKTSPWASFFLIRRAFGFATFADFLGQKTPGSMRKSVKRPAGGLLWPPAGSLTQPHSTKCFYSYSARVMRPSGSAGAPLPLRKTMCWYPNPRNPINQPMLRSRNSVPSSDSE